jgi:hypothetical protein
MMDPAKKHKYLNIANANKIYAANGAILRKPVIPLHQIRRRNFKISELKRSQNDRKVSYPFPLTPKKMNYFMETIELKGQCSHYQEENKRLHIHLNKLIKLNRERAITLRENHVDIFDSQFDINAQHERDQIENNNISLETHQVL